MKCFQEAGQEHKRVSPSGIIQNRMARTSVNLEKACHNYYYITNAPELSELNNNYFNKWWFWGLSVWFSSAGQFFCWYVLGFCLLADSWKLIVPRWTHTHVWLFTMKNTGHVSSLNVRLISASSQAASCLLMPHCLKQVDYKTLDGINFKFCDQFFFSFFNIYLFIYLFIYLCMAALGLRRCVGASHCGGFSCCGARALGARASVAVARRL